MQPKREHTDHSEHHQDAVVPCGLLLLKLFCAASTSCSKAHFAFKGDHEILLLRSHPWMPSQKTWQRIAVQKAYAASNRPLQHVCVSDFNGHVAVAGSRGLAIFDSIHNSWKVFGDITQEQELCVLGLIWWGEQALVVLARESEGRGALSLRIYPTTRLDSGSMLCAPLMLPVGFKPHFFEGVIEEEDGDTSEHLPVLLVLVAGTRSFMLYRLRQDSPLKTRESASIVSISVLGEGSLPSVEMPLQSESAIMLPCHPIKIALLPNVHPRQIALLDHSGKLLTMEIGSKKMQVVQDSSVLDFFYLGGAAGIWPTSLPPAFLILCRDTIEIWMPTTADKGFSRPGECSSEFDESLASHAIMTEFETDIYNGLNVFSPSFGILFKSGVQISVEQEFLEMKGQITAPTYFLQAQRVPIIHHILRKLLLLNRTRSSSLLVDEVQTTEINGLSGIVNTLVTFHEETDLWMLCESFGLLISTGLECFYKATKTLENIRKRLQDPSRAMINAEILAKTLLVDYIELVEQSVPDHFQEIFGNVARKSEASRWELLFSLQLQNGLRLTPSSLFDACFRSNNLKVASWYLPLIAEGSIDFLPSIISAYLRQSKWKNGISHALSCRLLWECLDQMNCALIVEMVQYTKKLEEAKKDRDEVKDIWDETAMTDESNAYYVTYMGTTLGEVLSRFFWKQFQERNILSTVQVIRCLKENGALSDLSKGTLQRAHRSMVESMDSTDEGMQELLGAFNKAFNSGQDSCTFFSALAEIASQHAQNSSNECSCLEYEEQNSKSVVKVMPEFKVEKNSCQKCLKALVSPTKCMDVMKNVLALLDVAIAVSHIEGILVFATLAFQKQTIMDCFLANRYLPLRNAYARFIADCDSLGNIPLYTTFGVSICIDATTQIDKFPKSTKK